MARVIRRPARFLGVGIALRGSLPITLLPLIREEKLHVLSAYESDDGSSPSEPLHRNEEPLHRNAPILPSLNAAPKSQCPHLA